jgi:hypothetical protein
LGLLILEPWTSVPHSGQDVEGKREEALAIYFKEESEQSKLCRDEYHALPANACGRPVLCDAMPVLPPHRKYRKAVKIMNHKSLYAEKVNAAGNSCRDPHGSKCIKRDHTPVKIEGRDVNYLAYRSDSETFSGFGRDVAVSQCDQCPLPFWRNESAKVIINTIPFESEYSREK